MRTCQVPLEAPLPGQLDDTALIVMMWSETMEKVNPVFAHQENVNRKHCAEAREER